MSATPLTLQPRPRSTQRRPRDPGDRLGRLDRCDLPRRLAVGPWDFDTRPGYGPGSSMGDVIPTGAPRRASCRRSTAMPPTTSSTPASARRRRRLGDRVVVLGHFYQREEVVRHADLRGRFVPNSRNAAKERPEAEAIVFCGVHFMAETADCCRARPGRDPAEPRRGLLDGRHGRHRPGRGVLGAARRRARRPRDPDAEGLVPVIPVTYMNSSAAIKGFVGRHGGIVCTSSNARTVLEWAFARGRRVLFFPTSTWAATPPSHGCPLEQMRCGTRASLSAARRPRCDRRQPGHPLARLLLGAPPLHRRPDRQSPRRTPGVRVIVHPSVRWMWSTPPTKRARPTSSARHRPPRPLPTTFAIGTEINLVQPWRSTRNTRSSALGPVVCPCSTMYRIHPGYLALGARVARRGRGRQPHHGPADVAEPATVALERMLAPSRTAR